MALWSTGWRGGATRWFFFTTGVNSQGCEQQAFIASYEKLLNRLEPDESVVFVDAVHPTHQARPTGCWAPKDVAIGIEQTRGRQRLRIHGAINLETGQTQMLEAAKVDAMSVIALLVAIEATYSGKTWIYVFLANATYPHAILVREWLGQPGRRIRLHFIPSYCPHLDPIERCWGVMHEHVTNNRSYETFAQFKSAILRFLRRTVPKKWGRFRDRITDNFRIISPDDFRVVASTRYNRENNREFCGFWRSAAILTPNRRQFNGFQLNSLRNGTGNFQTRIREIFSRNREFSREILRFCILSSD